MSLLYSKKTRQDEVRKAQGMVQKRDAKNNSESEMGQLIQSENKGKKGFLKYSIPSSPLLNNLLIVKMTFYVF